MTDPHDLDDLASALLDGTTSAEESALLADDAALLRQVEARAEELRSVRHALAELPPVDASRRDAAIAAALAAFDAEVPGAADATVTPLAPRRGLSPRAVRALSAAAVLLLIALLVPLLASIDRHDDDEASFSSTGAAIAEDSAGDGAEAQTPTAAAPSTTQLEPQKDYRETDASRSSLGAFDDLDALAAAIATGGFDSTERNLSASFDGEPCVADPGADTELEFAMVADRAVEVYVTTDADGTRTLTVRAADTCQVLDRREL